MWKSSQIQKNQPSLNLTPCGLGTWTIDSAYEVVNQSSAIFYVIRLALSDKIGPAGSPSSPQEDGF